MTRLKALIGLALGSALALAVGGCARSTERTTPTAPSTSTASSGPSTTSAAPPTDAAACALPAFPTLTELPEGADLLGQAVVGIASIRVRFQSMATSQTAEAGPWITIDVQRGPAHLPGPSADETVEVRTADHVVRAAHRTEERLDDEGTHRIGFLTWSAEPGLAITATSYDVELPQVLELLTSLRLAPLAAFESFLAEGGAEPVCP